MADGLNHRQELFLAHYLDAGGPHKGNATASALAAGYKQPNVQGPRLLVNVRVAARVADHERALQAGVLDRGIAERQARLDTLNDMAGRLTRTIQARAADYSMRDVPGGPEGIVVRSYKAVKVYTATGPLGGDRLHPARDDEPETLYPAKQTVLLAEYAVDTGTLAELRATLKQAAQEVGQWSEKSEITGANGGPQEVTLVFDRRDDAGAIAEVDIS